LFMARLGLIGFAKFDLSYSINTSFPNLVLCRKLTHLQNRYANCRSPKEFSFVERPEGNSTRRVDCWPPSEGFFGSVRKSY